MARRRRSNEEWDGTERRRQPTVLIVNDDPDACEMLVRFVGHHGFHTVGAHNDTETMTAAFEHFPRAVVLDMVVGGIGSSLKILDQIRTSNDRRVQTARVVLCASSPRNRSFSFQSGADAFLVHPFHLQDLVDDLQDVLDRPHAERARHRRDQLATR